MRFGSPYTPGAGAVPKYLAGRDELLKNAEKSIIALVKGYPQQSVVYLSLIHIYLHGTDITTDADRCSFTEHRLFTDFKVIFGDADRRVPAGTYYCIRFYVTV